MMWIIQKLDYYNPKFPSPPSLNILPKYCWDKPTQLLDTQIVILFAFMQKLHSEFVQIK